LSDRKLRGRTITERHVRDWHRASSAHKHPTQTANAYNLLRSVMSEAMSERLIEANPCTVRGAAGIRTVYAPASLLPDLANATTGRSADELLFVARDGHSPLHDSFLRKAHLKARAAINRPTLRIHELRKTAAALAAQQGATVRELMEMLGHTTPTVAMIYQAAGAERMQAIANRLDDQWAQLSHTAAD
jgi:integrase